MFPGIPIDYKPALVQVSAIITNVCILIVISLKFVS